MLRESDEIKYLKGVGEKSALAFNQIGVESIRDLLMYLPLRYDTYTMPVHIDSEYIGKVISVKGTLAGTPLLRKGKRQQIITAVASDDGMKFNLAWFHMPYLKKSLFKGESYIFRGRLNRNNFGYGFEQAQIFKEEDYKELTKGLQPVYRTSQGITASRIRKTVKEALDQVAFDEDILPDFIREKYSLADKEFAIRQMHFPEDNNKLLYARKRLVFEEFLLFIMAIRSLRENKKEALNTYDFSKKDVADNFIKNLPYRLTGAQQKVICEISSDLTGKLLMNRLIQGDVGSGKTILAMYGLIRAAENGYQGALMAPTEVLARQHFENFTKMFVSLNIPYKCELLTGSMTAKEKKEAYERISSHKSDIIIGTHALIQEKALYDNLALVVTDEQHRFGVKQRETLFAKGNAPHVIVMSATPIPRTLAIIIYGDLDISVLNEMPIGRKPIKNCVVGTSYRNKAYEFIRQQVRDGHQAYVVCSKVEEGEADEGENVIDYSEKLREALPAGITVEYLHGKMRPAEKNEIMQRFKNGEINVLVSTTVIEVGVDVPNATVMMIEDAERFGLAQLHQLRGRVGRGSAQSYCIFINGSDDPDKQKRLDILNHSNDGFVIAGEDLKMRGPGDVFGIRQSGNLNFAIGDIFTDSNILKDASDAADYLAVNLNEYPYFSKKLKEYSGNNLEKLNL